MLFSGAKRPALIAVAVMLATVVLYWPVTHYNFVHFDDDQYVYENPWVTSGLHWSTVKWAFTSTYAANWHPVTWISHLLDYTVFGLSPGGPHLVNIVLHALNSLLLFFLLAKLTKEAWASLIVCAFFAFHPLHVESVAWISERKDVLSAFWWILTIWAYAKSVPAASSETVTKRNGQESFFYDLSLFLFLLGLMSKPMVVTLPFVLLLLDFWPLKRFDLRPNPQTGRRLDRNRIAVLMEKIPFLLLVAGACFLTVTAQGAGGAIKNSSEIPLVLRLTNVPQAYLFYLFKTLCPIHLCAFYPFPPKPLVAQSILLLLVLAAISLGFFKLRLRFPWLLVGWLWFLGTLVPTIGLVQVGGQAAADRYMYIPSIGLFIMLGWSVISFVKARPESRTIVATVVVAAAIMCALVSQWQMVYWKNSAALFSRILQFSDCDMAENGLGVALSGLGRKQEAIERFRAAIRLNPRSVRAHYNLGIDLAATGKPGEALAQFDDALKLNPRSEQLHNNAGVILAQQGKLDEALGEFQESIRLNPVYPKPYLNCARAYQARGSFDLAVKFYREALRAEPDSVEVLGRFSQLLASCPDQHIQNPKEAVQLAEEANRLTHAQDPDCLSILSEAYAAVGNFTAAADTAATALKFATARGMTDLIPKLHDDLARYRKQK